MYLLQDALYAENVFDIYICFNNDGEGVRSYRRRIILVHDVNIRNINNLGYCTCEQKKE